MTTNIILVTVDCLRADHTGFGGYRSGITPFLDQLASESIVFENAIAAGIPTYYSFPVLLASRYPLAFGRDFMGLVKDEPTFVSALHDSGFQTAALIAGNPYLSRHFHYDQNFDLFDDFSDFQHIADAPPKKYESTPGVNHQSVKARANQIIRSLAGRTQLTQAFYRELYLRYSSSEMVRIHDGNLAAFRRYPPADVVMDKAIAWMRRAAGQRVFLWVHLMDPHYPYFPPRQALEAIGRNDLDVRQMVYLNALWSRDDIGRNHRARYLNDMLTLYDGGIHWVDTQVRRLVDASIELGIWDNTVLVLAGDHGEEFLEHGGHYHYPEKLSQELIHVPLLIRQPTSNLPIRLSTPFRLINLAPTLLAMQNIKLPEGCVGTSYGQGDRIKEEEDSVAITESLNDHRNPSNIEDRRGPRLLAIQNKRYKLVIDFSTRMEQLFDLLTDPAEVRPLAPNGSFPSRRRLLEVAREHIKRTSSADRTRLRAHLNNLMAKRKWVRMK